MASALFMLYMIHWYIQKKDISSLTSEADGEIIKVVKQDFKDPDSGEDKTLEQLQGRSSKGSLVAPSK